MNGVALVAEGGKLRFTLAGECDSHRGKGPRGGGGKKTLVNNEKQKTENLSVLNSRREGQSQTQKGH